MAIIEKQLSQTRITGTGAVTLYTAPTGVTAVIKFIAIVNTDNSEAHDVNLYHDDDGTTATAVTIIYQDVSVPSNSSTPLRDLWVAVAAGGSIMTIVSTGTPDVTISLYGIERT